MKKSSFLLLLGILFGISVFAQKMNFQGKIFVSGVPATGTHYVTFTINSLSPTWTETDEVNINNGLYSVQIGSINPLPLNLFDSANGTRQMIVQYDGATIDTVSLYAPFERDPNIPRYIRDSITWSDVHYKPSIDTSFTNEIQFLSISGDSLKISQGNYVIIHGLNDTLQSTIINGNLTVIDSTTTNIITVPSGGSWTVLPTSPLTGVWQSFKAPNNGKLKRIRVNIYSTTVPTVVFTFYTGQGTGTPSLISPLTLPCPTTFGTAILDVSSLNLSLFSGNTYTFCLVPSTGGAINAQIQGNVYTGGIEGTFVPSTSSTVANPGNDLSFSIDVDNTNPSCLTFGSNCYVGIGTNTPTSQLEVRGRVKDQSGFIMPVGTVISYMGKTIPQGWLQCDGSAVSRVTYSDLFEVIDTTNGHGDGMSTFNLPDLRGRFLRGIDTSASVGASGNDADRALRTSAGGPNGGNSGNGVGSKQSDEVATHNHNSITDPISGQTFNTMYSTPVVSNSTWYSNANIKYKYQGVSADYTEVLVNSSLANYGGSETRPRNTYVYYIIKY